MTVVEVYRNEIRKLSELTEEDKEIISYFALCSDAKIEFVDGEEKRIGDPTETALIELNNKYGVDIKNIKRICDVPFDSDRKMMSVVVKLNDKILLITKGAPDQIINHSVNKEAFELALQVNENMAQRALRVLGIGVKELTEIPSETDTSIEEGLTFLGLVGMIDPARPEVKKALEVAKSAGIRTVMITGDHKITAIAIAKALGILENESEALTGSELEEMTDEELTKNIRKYSVYARVSPEHKVRIVKAWQANGEIVAMTGDGVNDAPALKTADIGCAMGIVGTDVAKEAADVILTDDNFATIVSAVEEGRRIYDNILKAIQFLLSSNVGEIIVLFVAILITPLLSKIFGIDIHLIEPLLPIHILWINLVTDSLPALALAVDPAEKDVMERKPIKPKKGIFTNGMSWRIIYQGVMIGLLTLAAFIIGLGTKDVPIIEGLTEQEVRVEIGQTMAFIVLALSELTHVFNIRNNKKSIFKTNIFNNSKLILAILTSSALMFVILLIPSLRSIFSIPVLPIGNIVEIVILVLMPIVIVEIFKLFKINTIGEK